MPALVPAAEALERLSAIEQKRFCLEWIQKLQANPFNEADWL
jgi:hypothetical protein